MNQVASKHKYLKGFTIIELMLTIAVAAVILTLGVPSFQGLMERNQLTTNINRFISSLALARSEAIKRNQRVVVCPSSDGDTCSNAGGYDNGWIIFVDADNNNSRDGGEELIWEGESIPTNMTLRGTNGGYNTAIPYIPSGRLAVGVNGSVRLCKDNQTDKARAITLIRSGRVRLAELDSSGKPLIDNSAMTNCST